MDECEVKFEDCEYDAETDTMTTTGKASFNGKEYDVSFIEHDGRAPVINLSSDNVEMGYANGATIDGYGLSTEEGKALYNAADTIYREMFEKADEYQREDPDAICARISYESKGIEKSDIEVVSIGRNKGDIGEIVGFVSINDDTLRFLADRDGNIMSLMPKGTPMQDVNTVPIADEVKCIICDAIHDGILEYNREAEIASNAIVKEAEERGWSVKNLRAARCCSPTLHMAAVCSSTLAKIHSHKTSKTMLITLMLTRLWICGAAQGIRAFREFRSLTKTLSVKQKKLVTCALSFPMQQQRSKPLLMTVKLSPSVRQMTTNADLNARFGGLPSYKEPPRWRGWATEIFSG